eukprot:6096219-Pleurochrysis_carterae.AAC.1
MGLRNRVPGQRKAPGGREQRKVPAGEGGQRKTPGVKKDSARRRVYSQNHACTAKIQLRAGKYPNMLSCRNSSCVNKWIVARRCSTWMMMPRRDAYFVNSMLNIAYLGEVNKSDELQDNPARNEVVNYEIQWYPRSSGLSEILKR